MTGKGDFRRRGAQRSAFYTVVALLDMLVDSAPHALNTFH